MKELLCYIVKSIVEDTEAVNIEEVENENAIVYKVTVAPDDIGRVIGKQGRIAKAIRTVVRAAANRSGEKVVVEID